MSFLTRQQQQGVMEDLREADRIKRFCCENSLEVLSAETGHSVTTVLRSIRLGRARFMSNDQVLSLIRRNADRSLARHVLRTQYSDKAIAERHGVSVKTIERYRSSGRVPECLEERRGGNDQLAQPIPTTN